MSQSIVTTASGAKEVPKKSRNPSRTGLLRHGPAPAAVLRHMMKPVRSIDPHPTAAPLPFTSKKSVLTIQLGN